MAGYAGYVFGSSPWVRIALWANSRLLGEYRDSLSAQDTGFLNAATEQLGSDAHLIVRLRNL